MKASSPKLNIIVAIGGVTIHLTVLFIILPTVNIDYVNVACSVSLYVNASQYVCINIQIHHSLLCGC